MEIISKSYLSVSTILKFILEIYKKHFSNNILLCAPTGRAARRMAESTGFLSASTIHSALDIKNDYSWAQSADSIPPLKADLVVIDESSMIDMELLYILINSIEFETKVVFLGDSEQLPSVGPGNCLREMIKSEIIPMVKLDVIYRQKGESKIVINSNKLNHQDFNFEYDDTFKFYEEYNPEKVRDIIVNLFTNELQKPNKSLDNVQILTPFKKDKIPCSTFEFNNLIQKSVNPISSNKMFMKVGRYTFLKGDKVIQQRNNDIAKNGDIGYIKSIEFDGTETFAVIDFVDGEQVKYSRADMEENIVELAYAITVHKSQGSEYSTVIMPIISRHEFMLNKNLIYTAWTRAKENVFLVGSKSVLKKTGSISNIDDRKTLLSQRMHQRDNQYKNKKLKRRKIS